MEHDGESKFQFIFWEKILGMETFLGESENEPSFRGVPSQNLNLSFCQKASCNFPFLFVRCWL